LLVDEELPANTRGGKVRLRRLNDPIPRDRQEVREKVR